ncbi:MAG: hypothetical protein JOZ23_06335 [Mycobacterium sp.]|nr:hypothetical protein [Mycobacterium sp.]
MAAAYRTVGGTIQRDSRGRSAARKRLRRTGMSSWCVRLGMSTVGDRGHATGRELVAASAALRWPRHPRAIGAADQLADCGHDSPVGRPLRAPAATPHDLTTGVVTPVIAVSFEDHGVARIGS